MNQNILPGGCVVDTFSSFLDIFTGPNILLGLSTVILTWSLLSDDSDNKD